MAEIIVSVYWLSLCIFFEARGEPFEGMVAVGHVVMNRVNNRKLSVKEVVQQPQQFSFWNLNERSDIKWEEFEDMERCLLAAKVCLEERLNGYNLKGANHYYNPNKCSPSWADSMVYIDRISNHIFLKG